jgi:hypothetical protein
MNSHFTDKCIPGNSIIFFFFFKDKQANLIVWKNTFDYNISRENSKLLETYISSFIIIYM